MLLALLRKFLYFPQYSFFLSPSSSPVILCFLLKKSLSLAKVRYSSVIHGAPFTFFLTVIKGACLLQILLKASLKSSQAFSTPWVFTVLSQLQGRKFEADKGGGGGGHNVFFSPPPAHSRATPQKKGGGGGGTPKLFSAAPSALTIF